MRLPMVILGGLCMWIGLFPAVMVSFVIDAAATGARLPVSAGRLENITRPLGPAVAALFLLIGTAALFILFKRIAVKFLPVEHAPTWGCGYSVPTDRMQYTASSFVEPVLRIFQNVLGYHVEGGRPCGVFPRKEEVSSRVVDTSEEFIFRPAFRGAQFLAARLKIIQNGLTQLYLFYIFIFLLLVLMWKML